MNETLIQKWNEKVQKGDVVYHLGDFGFTRGLRKDILGEMRKFLKRLNGQINLILGNHDCQNMNEQVKGLFSSTCLLKDKTINGRRIIMCHYSMIVWPGKHKGSWMLAGHSHNNLPCARKDSNLIGKLLDVGVDGNNFYPYSFDEIKEIMDKKDTFPASDIFNDHHKNTDEE